MKINTIATLLAIVFSFNGQAYATSDGEEKIQLLERLIQKAEKELDIKVRKRPVYYEDVSVKDNSRLGYAPFRMPKDEKIVIYKNSISYFWVYSEPGRPYYWYRYDSVSSFLNGYFKDAIGMRATSFGRRYYDRGSMETMMESAELVEAGKRHKRSRLEEKLDAVSHSKLAIEVQNTIFQ